MLVDLPLELICDWNHPDKVSTIFNLHIMIMFIIPTISSQFNNRIVNNLHPYAWSEINSFKYWFLRLYDWCCMKGNETTELWSTDTVNRSCLTFKYLQLINDDNSSILFFSKPSVSNLKVVTHMSHFGTCKLDYKIVYSPNISYSPTLTNWPVRKGQFVRHWTNHRISPHYHFYTNLLDY